MSILVEAYFKKDRIILELDTLEVHSEEKEKLLKVVDEIAQLRLLDAALEKLEEKDKQLFLEQLQGGSAQMAAQILREGIENVEEILLERAKVLEEEILVDIRSLKGTTND
ncbi:MAG: hypothetical protein WD187_02890 [Candidatus Woykebacteria bacterium]